MANAAKSIENICRTPRLRHRIGLAGIALVGATIGAASAYDAYQASKHVTPFGIKGDEQINLGSNRATLSAAQHVPLSPNYRPLDATPVIKRAMGDLLDNKALDIGTWGVSLALGAAGLRWAGAQLQASRASAAAALAHRVANSARQDPRSYETHNVDTLDAILDGPLPEPTPAEIATQEAQFYHGIANSYGLKPDADARAVVHALKSDMNDTSRISPLATPIFLPTLVVQV